MQQITTSVQTLTISQNLEPSNIDAILKQVSRENSLPSIDVIHYANMWFNLYNSPNFAFQPSPAVKLQLYYAAHSKIEQYGILLGEGFNCTDLSATDTAALFYILNSFQAYEKEKKGELAIFPEVVFYFQQYILRLCHRDEYKARQVLDALISYNNPSNDAIIEKMRLSITAIAKTNENHNKASRYQFGLPKDLWLRIFENYLSPEDLGRVAQVCKQFQILSYDNVPWKGIEKRLPSIYPSLRVIGPEAWQEYVDLERFELTVEEGPAPLSKRAELIPIMKMIHQLAPQVEGNAGVTILTIPEGLTFNKLVEIARSPKKGSPTDFRIIWDFPIDFRRIQELRNIRVDQTYRIIITNNLLLGSRGKDFDVQQKLANDLGCAMPRLLEASTLAILTAIISQTRLLGDAPMTFTRCFERISHENLNNNFYYNMLVGRFIPDGLGINVSFHDHATFGALVMQKIEDLSASAVSTATVLV